MKKKGFTLVELLAVIAILAILVIIALPNVMGMFNNAKKNTFLTEIKKIYRGAEQAYVKDSFNNSGSKIYSKCSSGCSNELDMSIRDDLEYYIEINSQGKVVKYYVHDNSYQYGHSGEMSISDITDAQNISDLDEDDIISISSNGVTGPHEKILVCKRATILHTVECSSGTYYNDSVSNSRNTYCRGDGYTPTGSKGTKEITFGSLGTSGTLTPGDAFDCDVNGDGIFNQENERFYYLSQKDNDSSSNYAVLLYYSNVIGGEINNTTTINYGTANFRGPEVAYLELPTTSQWKNVSLSETSRQIRTGFGLTYYENDGDKYNLPVFDYSGRAARFVAISEIIHACGGAYTNNSYMDQNALGYLSKNCIYTLENTQYIYSSYAGGYWFESYSDGVNGPLAPSGCWRNISSKPTTMTNANGVRPAIEVPLDNIEI